MQRSRQAEYAERRVKQGWKRKCVWVPPHALITWAQDIKKLKKSWEKKDET